METMQEGHDRPKLILRGVKELDNGDLDTTVLLFKGKGNYLQGYVKVGDQKHQVLAYLNERMPDKITGKVKPNYIKLCEPRNDGDDTKWQEIGFGNAVNHRKDEKPVYFDEVLFSVGGKVIKAQITRHVDEELHRKLGFQEPRKARPNDADKSATSTGEPSPKAAEPAAKEKKAASASKARPSPRAKAA